MRLLLSLVISIISASAADLPAPPAGSTAPAGSVEATVRIGDTRLKVEALLGEVDSLDALDRFRTRVFFKRCSIVFESGKVAQLPVMRSPDELATLEQAKAKAEKEKAAAAQPGTPQNLKRCRDLVAALLPRFEAVVSRPGFPVIYVHKAFPAEKYGIMPSVLVDDQGSLALATSYYGGAWLFHDSVGVRIADKNHASSILPRSKPQRQVADAGFILERCVFDTQVDQQLVREISTAKGKRIFISLLKQGGSVLGGLTEQQFASFPPIAELTAAEISAVRDSVELADAFAGLQASK
jgi:hypothetical protein